MRSFELLILFWAPCFQPLDYKSSSLSLVIEVSFSENEFGERNSLLGLKIQRQDIFMKVPPQQTWANGLFLEVK